MAEPMFDKDSFQEEITSPAEAQSCVTYLTHNERNFRKGLMEEGLTHEQEEEAVKAVWLNLIKSCQRVGYTDSIVETKTRKYAKS